MKKTAPAAFAAIAAAVIAAILLAAAALTPKMKAEAAQKNPAVVYAGESVLSAPEKAPSGTTGGAQLSENEGNEVLPAWIVALIVLVLLAAVAGIVALLVIPFRLLRRAGKTRKNLLSQDGGDNGGGNGGKENS